jgi:threonine/homoserine/homoserine lactone efflux protein
MPELPSLLLFLAAATALAVTPGPGIAYVAARTLAGGRAEGIASSIGTALGGCFHILAGALGVSALVLASAEAFTLLKLIGAAYLIWIGVKTIREGHVAETGTVAALGTRRAFRDGVVIEMLNPKTAAFFLAFIPQFISPAGSVATQFVLLGLICVALNTAVDVVVALVAARTRSALAGRSTLVARIRQGAGGMMVALGVTLALARRPV